MRRAESRCEYLVSGFRNQRFAVPKKSTRLYQRLACDKILLVNGTVFACSSVVCPVLVALLYLRLWRDEVDHVGHFNTVCRSKKINTLITQPYLDNIRLVDSTVFACSSVVCPAFVVLL